jgi:hypothetical protein
MIYAIIFQHRKKNLLIYVRVYMIQIDREEESIH